MRSTYFHSALTMVVIVVRRKGVDHALLDAPIGTNVTAD
jgi:hypothetical protein